jgi:hypothetical protein
MGVKPNRPEYLKRNPKAVADKAKADREAASKPLAASDLLKPNHPLRGAFQAWCVKNSVEETRRQAAKFLASYPTYRQASPA